MMNASSLLQHSENPLILCQMVFVPKGFAHGFQTLEDNTEVIYQMSEFYYPGHSSGFRWNDPSFNIKWPTDPRVISSKDQSFPDFNS